MSNILFQYNNQRYSSMLRIDLTYIYDLLQSIHLLTSLDYRFYPNLEHEEVLPNIIQAYRMLSPSIYNFRLSYSHIQQLKDSLEDYYKSYIDSEEVKKGKQYINYNKLKDIAGIALKLQFLLKSELANQQVYLVTAKSAYDTEILIHAPEYIFPPDLSKKIPKTQYDIQECAKALAFELPTACAFHLMRIFELVFIQYYSVIIPTGNYLNNKGHKKPIGSLIQEVIEISEQNTNAIVDILKSIKDNYRNPLIHSEINMEMQEVLVLLGVVYGAISLMLEKLVDTIGVTNEQM